MTRELPEAWQGLLLYAVPALLAVGGYGLRRRGEERRARAVRLESMQAGLVDPPSLHPVINPNRCVGCGTCVRACPEHGVLGIIAGRAELVNPSDCIGHGACKDACPADAITLVLGTERRGVDVPSLRPNFETNVPGIFVAGELGGMGLIRNAIEQGRQAIDAIRARPGIGSGDALDVFIVGAGPAGFSASLAALQHGLRAVTVEQETLGGTVAHYPRGKIVMTAPALLPLVGPVKMRETTKEALLAFWSDVEKRTGVKIQYRERLETVRRTGDLFEIQTTRGSYRAHSLLLAIGRRGTPRKLGVPGEEQEKVVYRLIEPEQYRGHRLLVVGGGDSAIEAAWSLATQPDTDVTLAYRGAAFNRAKPANRKRIEEVAAGGRARLLTESQVEAIHRDAVHLRTPSGRTELPNDSVIVCAGGVLPTQLLSSLGIEMETRFGT